MESVVPLGCTNKATLGVKLLSATVPAGQFMWLSVHFNEHTMAAFLFKCIEDPTYSSPTIPPPSSPPIPYTLNPWYWCP